MFIDNLLQRQGKALSKRTCKCHAASLSQNVLPKYQQKGSSEENHPLNLGKVASLMTPQ